MSKIDTEIVFELRKYGADKKLADLLIQVRRNALIAWLYAKRQPQNAPIMQSFNAFCAQMHGELNQQNMRTIHYRYVERDRSKVACYKNVMRTLNEAFAYPRLWNELSRFSWGMCVETVARILLNRGEDPRDVAILINRSYANIYSLRDKMKREQKNTPKIKT